jgi:hypothetical protein
MGRQEEKESKTGGSSVPYFPLHFLVQDRHFVSTPISWTIRNVKRKINKELSASTLYYLLYLFLYCPDNSKNKDK